MATSRRQIPIFFALTFFGLVALAAAVSIRGPAPVKGQSCSWAGQWQINGDVDHNIVTFSQSGNKVTGGKINGQELLDGTVSGNRLTGRWQGGSDGGPIEMTMDGSCTSFTGTFGWPRGRPASKFGGTRIGPPPPAATPVPPTQAAAQALRVVQHVVARDVREQPCCTATPATTFSPQDPRAYSFVELAGAAGGSALRWDFLDPRGTLYFTLSARAEFDYHWAFIDIAGNPAADLLGAWTVTFSIDGRVQFRDSFTIGAPPPPPPPPAGAAAISTDKASYGVGETLQFCYRVPGPGQVTIIDRPADGRSQVILAGIDDGRGDCLTGEVTLPAGTECLELAWSGSSGQTASARVCFQVVAAGAPPPPPPPVPPPVPAGPDWVPFPLPESLPTPPADFTPPDPPVTEPHPNPDELPEPEFSGF